MSEPIDYRRLAAHFEAQRDEAQGQYLAMGTQRDELQRRIDSLTALLAQAEADNRAWAERCRWIPVGEKMPEAGQRVHVWDGRDQGVGVPLAGFRGGWATTHGVPPTHWRPLDPGPDAT